ncbi:MAG TPA: hypothetical protein VJ846_03690 [Sphingomicrobium sp.]|nr:hypothetical protein [Sphingomicrobium sp.]
MVALFKVKALATEELSEVWPIVRSSGDYANEDWWIAEASRVIANGGGVLVARAADGCLHAVASFERPERPGHDALVVRTLITFELSPNEPARTAVLNALKRIATKLQCTHLILPLAGVVRPPHERIISR